MFIPGGGSRGWEELSREAGRADVARFAVRPLGVVGASEVFDDHPSLGADNELSSQMVEVAGVEIELSGSRKPL